jgi:hypothetical protein
MRVRAIFSRDQYSEMQSYHSYLNATSGSTRAAFDAE